MAKRVVKVGILSRAEYVQRTLAMVRGERKPAQNEPKIWFESLKSLAQVLSEQNQMLLGLIERRQPQSLNELEAWTGRRASNLSRTLKTLERHGLVELRREHKRLIPTVVATCFQVDVEIGGQRPAS